MSIENLWGATIKVGVLIFQGGGRGAKSYKGGQMFPPPNEVLQRVCRSWVAWGGVGEGNPWLPATHP